MNNNPRTHLAAVLACLLFAIDAASAPDPMAAGPTASTPHNGIACSQCHAGAVARAVAASAAADRDPRSRACRTCHRGLAARSRTAASGTGFHAEPAADCLGCHVFHRPGVLKTAAGEVRLGPSPGVSATSGHCAGCHDEGAALANLSRAHRAAAALYHRDAATLSGTSPSQGCLNCHAADSGSRWQQETGDQTLVFNPHATHPLGVEVIAGSGQDERRIRSDIDPRLRLFAGRIECQTCHELTATTTDLLVPFDQAQDLCLGCHALKNAPPRPPRALMATMMAVE